MFNNKWVVAGLAALAVWILYKNVVVTLMGEYADTPVDVVDVDVDDPDAFLVEATDDGSGIETAEQGFKFSSAQRDLKRINVAAIAWNTDPARDPFVPQAALAANAIEQVQAQVSSASKVATAVRRNAPEVWPEIDAVVSSASHQYAVIDGEIRGIGERFDRYKLVDVTVNGVRLVDLYNFKSQEVMVTP
ncbi:MAG: hypothetical protein AAF004_02245 [Pseudomonadota bacterium]